MAQLALPVDCARAADPASARNLFSEADGRAISHLDAHFCTSRDGRRRAVLANPELDTQPSRQPHSSKHGLAKASDLIAAMG